MISDNVIIAMLSSIPPTVAAVSALIVSLMNSRKMSYLALEAKGTTKTINEIHVLADGNLSKTTTDLAVANQKILGLEKLMQQLVAGKAEIAQALKIMVVDQNT